MSKESKNQLSKEDFISQIGDLSPKEINEIIINRGKKPKLMCGLIYYTSKKDED